MTAVGARALLCLALLTLVGCTTQVERLDPEESRDLSGKWNDTDSRLVAEAMIDEALQGRWLNQHQGQTEERPAVIVGEVRNLSQEHINVRTFINDIERALINSGRVEFVAAPEERGAIREERQDQAENARPDTRNAPGRELGADYMLQGSINTIFDREGSQQVRYYQVDLTLVSLADNRKVWVGQKKIKKLVTKPGLRL